MSVRKILARKKMAKISPRKTHKVSGKKKKTKFTITLTVAASRKRERLVREIQRSIDEHVPDDTLYGGAYRSKIPD